MKISEFWKIVNRYDPTIQRAHSNPQALNAFALDCFACNRQGEDIDKIRDFYVDFNNGTELFEKG